MEEVNPKILASAPGAVFFSADEWHYVEEAGGQLIVEGLTRGPYVKTGAEEKIYETIKRAVEKALAEGRGQILRHWGGKAEGKTTATAVALYMWLKQGGGGKAPVVAIDLGAPVDGVKVAKFMREARRLGYVPILYLDTSPPEAYATSAAAAAKHSVAASSLIKLLSAVDKYGGVALLVYSEDFKNFVDREYRDALWDYFHETEYVDADTNKEVLVSGILSYSGCPKDVVDKATRLILSEFADGYAFAAVKVAEGLREDGCDANLEAEVRVAREEALRYALKYLWHSVLEEKVDDRVARSLALTAFFINLERRVRIARGGKREPLNLLEDVVLQIASNAAYNIFRVGNNDLCGSDDSGPCRVVDEVRRALKRALPRKKEYKDLNDVLDDFYASTLVNSISA